MTRFARVREAVRCLADAGRAGGGWRVLAAAGEPSAELLFWACEKRGEEGGEEERGEESETSMKMRMYSIVLRTHTHTHPHSFKFQAAGTKSESIESMACNLVSRGWRGFLDPCSCKRFRRSTAYDTESVYGEGTENVLRHVVLERACSAVPFPLGSGTMAQ